MDQLQLDFSSRSAEKRIVVFDLETQLSAAEVGGWGNKHLMRVAVGAVHDSTTDRFTVFTEKNINGLIELLHSADLVVGFNSRNFDYGVLKGYTSEPLDEILPTFDILEEIKKQHNIRIKLDNFAKNTLGEGKSADGLQSLRWFKEGKINLISEYCIHDVKVTRDLFLFGLERKYLLYGDKKGERKKLGLNWDLTRHYRRKP